MNATFDYALASAVQKHGMLLHGWVGMSNHSHDTITDVHGVLPDFMRDFHRGVAMAVKEHRGIAECVWADAPTAAVELHGERAQIDAVLYGVMNPVRACLVEKAADWPGAIWLPGQRELVAKRPDVWFSEKQPEVVRVPVVPPPAWSSGHVLLRYRCNRPRTGPADERQHRPGLRFSARSPLRVT